MTRGFMMRATSLDHRHYDALLRELPVRLGITYLNGEIFRKPHPAARTRMESVAAGRRDLP